MKKTQLLAIAPVLIGLNLFAQWEVLTSGVTESLNSVYFSDLGTGYAVGDNGTILNTTDGGATWNSQSSGTDQELIYICNPEANAVFVVAANGMILKTTDDGTSRDVEISASDFNLRDAFFIDEITIFGGGSYWDSVVIVSATIGGTWNIQYSVITECPAVWLSSIVFFDVNIGYATGGRAHANQTEGILLKTTDGGITWVVLAVETVPLNSVFFTGSDKGYVAGGYCNELGCSGEILKTTDGGTTWIAQNIPPNTETLNSVCFPDANTGYLTGDNGIIFKTNDGGTIWSFQTSNSNQNLYSICFPDATTGYIVGDYGTILKTTNGGFPVGTDEKQQMSSLKIYPNPAINHITIELSESGTNINGTYTIFGMSGLALIQQQVQDSRSEINVSSLPKGIYFVRLSNNENIDYGNFIKEQASKINYNSKQLSYESFINSINLSKKPRKFIPGLFNI
jgi:photosystem II stability/assembly factor-like uncharacterized protein